MNTTAVKPSFFKSNFVEITSIHDEYPKDKIPYLKDDTNDDTNFTSINFYDEGGNYYRNRIILMKDFTKINDIATIFVKRILKDNSLSEPRWSHKYCIEGHIVNLKTKKECIYIHYDAWLGWMMDMYKCNRYKQRQPMVLEDIIKDFKDFEDIIPNQESNIHFQLLLRVAASRIGYALGNVAGY